MQLRISFSKLHGSLGLPLAARRELRDHAGRHRLRGLAAGIGMHLGVHDEYHDVLARGENMVKPAIHRHTNRYARQHTITSLSPRYSKSSPTVASCDKVTALYSFPSHALAHRGTWSVMCYRLSLLQQAAPANLAKQPCLPCRTSNMLTDSQPGIKLANIIAIGTVHLHDIFFLDKSGSRLGELLLHLAAPATPHAKLLDLTLALALVALGHSSSHRAA